MIHPRAYGLMEGRSYNTCLEHLSPWLLVPISLLSGPVCVQPSQSFSNNCVLLGGQLEFVHKSFSWPSLLYYCSSCCFS
jgi:hypothetical protein